MRITTTQLKKLIRETVRETLEEQEQLAGDISSSLGRFRASRMQVGQTPSSQPTAQQQQQKNNLLTMIRNALRSGVLTVRDLWSLVSD